VFFFSPDLDQNSLYEETIQKIDPIRPEFLVLEREKKYEF